MLPGNVWWVKGSVLTEVTRAMLRIRERAAEIRRTAGPMKGGEEENGANTEKETERLHRAAGPAYLSVRINPVFRGLAIRTV